MGLTPRQWIFSNAIITTTLQHTISPATLDAYFTEFLTHYNTYTHSVDATSPFLTLDNITSAPSDGQQHYRVYYTYPANNHPFLIYWNSTKTCHLMMPLGNRVAQINVNDVMPLASYFTSSERKALIVLTVKSIVVRQTNLLLHPKYSVLNCNIVAECVSKVQQITASHTLTSSEKLQKTTETEAFYIGKIHLLLDKYFSLLQDGRFEEGMRFLKGEYNRFFTTQGLSEMFVDTQNLVGHLEIFIYLYSLLKILRNFQN